MEKNNLIPKDKLTVEDVHSILKTAAEIIDDKEFTVLLADNLTTGALTGGEEKEFVPVNLSKLLDYIADMMW